MATVTTSDGVKLNYTDEGAGTPVVMIAGFTAPLESWEMQRRALLAAGHRVLGLDRRAHGGSDTPAYGQRISRHGKDVHDFLAALGLDEVVLAGGSMGASTIWAYYDLFGAERLRAIVTVDQTPKMINDNTWAYGFYGLTRDNLGTFFGTGIPRTGRGRDPAKSMPQHLALVEALGGRPPAMRDPDAPETKPLLQNHAEQDWRDVLARIEVPALYLAGRDSQLWPCEHASAAAESNKLATAVILEDCGHAANIDQPDQVNAAIVEFLK